MTLDYKILWIDDREEFFRNHKSYIEDYLEDLGFDTDIITYKSFTEFKENEPDATNQKIYDLFLIDLNLDHGETGDEIIQIIRENHILTDIIFYSTNLQDVRQKVNDNHIEGVYMTNRNRDDFEEKVIDVIDVTIKKVQDVNNLRGLIMAEVAELDRINEQIIISASQKISDQSIEKYTLRKVKDSGNSNKNKAQRYLDDIENVTFESLFASIGFIDSNKKAMTTGEILDKFNITEPVSKEKFIQPYVDDILGKRNKFAHIKECNGEDENGVSCKVIGDIPFTSEKCIEIRKEIKKYKKILIEIEEKINE